MVPENVVIAKIGILLFVIQLSGIDSGYFINQRISYIAAVVEYEPVSLFNNHKNILEANADAYSKFIVEAKTAKADIVVFPEYGLSTLQIPANRTSLMAFLVPDPEIGENPCLLQEDTSPVLHKLSCSARSESMYVIVNLGVFEVETEERSFSTESDIFHYNSNIVFNRQGQIVAKYRKYNLYFEPYFDAPEIPDYTTFETDFGVTFGTFICFDIIFQCPCLDYLQNGVRNFIYTSAWMDELPFLSASQSNALWAMGADANLLASGYHRPSQGQLGSGIFSDSMGPLNYTVNPASGSRMVVAEVPIIPHKSTMLPIKSFPQSQISMNYTLTFLKENLSSYASYSLNVKEANSVKVCHNYFCCSLQYKFHTFNYTESIGGYKLIAFNGFRKVARETAKFGWQVCGVLRCASNALESCTEISQNSKGNLPTFTKLKLWTKSMKINELMKPSLNTLDTDFQIIPYRLFNLVRKWGIVKAESLSLQNTRVQTIALINRLYE